MHYRKIENSVRLHKSIELPMTNDRRCHRHFIQMQQQHQIVQKKF